MYCCMNGSYCGTKSECDRSKIIFASVLGAILGVLILLLIIWFIVTKINKNRKKKALGSYNEEIAKQNELNLSPEREKGQGVIEVNSMLICLDYLRSCCKHKNPIVHGSS
jgi:hypothetical protein